MSPLIRLGGPCTPPLVACLGIRTKTSSLFTGPRILIEGWITQRFGSWQETKDILHLDNYARIRIGKICIYYFKAIYKKTEFKAKSKNKGLQLLRYGTI